MGAAESGRANIIYFLVGDWGWGDISLQGSTVPTPEFDGISGAGYYSDIKYEVDRNIGRILDALEASGAEGETVVILTGDNGPGTLLQGGGYASGEVGGSTGPWRGGLSTGFEGGMRTPAMIRWPGKVPAGAVTDEIVSVLDVYPTLAALAGASARVPSDRPIDGIDQSAFLLGEQEHSNRDHVVTFIGDEIFAVKWRDLKVHFATAESTFSEIKRHTFPQVYNIKEDPAEQFELWGNEGFSHAWVMTPVTGIISALKASMAEYPNIRPGEDLQGYE